MSSHPDADAFMRTYLRTPADTTTRLVFADWLEETGTASNIAWAHFIRAKVEADRHPTGSRKRAKLDTEAGEYARHIRARLTIPVVQCNQESLLQLLPGPNITVRLAGCELPLALVELVPESVARDNIAIPLWLEGPTLTVALANVRNADTIQKLGFILNKDVVALCADPDDILDAINRHYGQTETESVDCISYESPLIGLEGDPESRSLFGIFITAFSEGAVGFEMRRERQHSSVRYLRGGEPLATETYPVAVYHRLLKHLLSLPPDADRAQGGIRCLDLDVPLLSGRQFPTTLEYEQSRCGPEWFRLRFRW